MNLNELEEKRKEILKKVLISVPFFIIGVLTLFGSEFIRIEILDNSWITYVIGAILIIIGISNSSKPLMEFNKLKKSFKETYLKKVIEEIYPNSVYNPTTGIDYKFALSSKIIPPGDRYKSEDLIKGTYEDVKFVTCDIQVEERHTRSTKHGTETYYVSIFKGRFFEFEFNKNFSSDLICAEKNSLTNNFGMHNVKLESVEFNKKFNTYAQSDHEAFYILTPQIMERMLTIEKENNGNCSFSFINNRFFFSLNNSVDTFELSLFKTIDDTCINTFNEEAKLMKEIIETLKLNININK